MMIRPQLPSLGDITKALLDHAGVLPQKNDSTGVIEDEKTKKKIQTQLRRLAKEESELENNLIDLLNLLAAFIQKATADSRVTNVCMDSIEDVLNQYKDLVRGDGTFLSKPEAVKWLIRTKLVDRTILSYQKNALKFNLSASNLISPSDTYWWLPDFTNQSTQWPLAKAMKWMYTVCETNQTHFHFPDFGSTDNYRLSQNLENASRWANGKNTPSWPNLLQNINDSIVAMEQTKSTMYKVVFDAKTQQNFKTILFIARFSTSIFIELERQFGRDFIVDITMQLRRQDRRLSKVHQSFKASLSKAIAVNNIPKTAIIDRIWYENTQEFWQLQSEHMIQGSRAIDAKFRERYNSGFNRKDLRFFLQRMNPFALSPLLEQAKDNTIAMAPKLFLELLLEGLALRKNGNTLPRDIKQYIKQVNEANLECYLDWVTNWIWATYHYRREEDDLAFPFYLKAFESGKYSAGNSQYKLVNQYVESCAKNNKWKDFKRGIAWANYLGIEVRWYRGVDESDEPLKTAYMFLKHARYAQL
ncbi:hypothetical protein [Shewanella colwelliana]|uniref:hypothetical protein n=1 Tax=Shewanella colwelliana TaxID=23 RepID=UPI003735197A